MVRVREEQEEEGVMREDPPPQGLKEDEGVVRREGLGVGDLTKPVRRVPCPLYVVFQAHAELLRCPHAPVVGVQAGFQELIS